jgi:hypothetical protein
MPVAPAATLADPNFGALRREARGITRLNDSPLWV